MAEPPEGWGPILTIKVSRAGMLWAAWTDDVHGVLVHGHSFAEVLEKFPAAKAEVERARAEGVVELPLIKCPTCGLEGMAFICSTPGCPVNGGADYG